MNDNKSKDKYWTIWL